MNNIVPVGVKLYFFILILFPFHTVKGARQRSGTVQKYIQSRQDFMIPLRRKIGFFSDSQIHK